MPSTTLIYDSDCGFCRWLLAKVPAWDRRTAPDAGAARRNERSSRAIYFGARVLILDEPTSALGVKQSGIVLRYVVQARDRGVAVVFISHNPHHAHPVGDRFVILNRGRLVGSWAKAEITRDQLARQMAGGAELEDLTEEIEAAISARPGERGATEAIASRRVGGGKD
jgi:simple sugar transport system ATP-binding protein